MSRLHTAVAALCLAPALALAQMASAPFEGRLKKIHDTKTINVAYRTDAVPFSFEDSEKKPTGYTVDLGSQVVENNAKDALENALLDLRNLAVYLRTAPARPAKEHLENRKNQRGIDFQQAVSVKRPHLQRNHAARRR